MPPTRLRRRLAPLVSSAVLALAAAACTDRANPLAPGPASSGSAPGAPLAIQLLACAVDRAAGTVVCRPATSGAGGVAADIIVGGQDVFTRLTSSNAAYNAGTEQYTFDMTLQNLIEQPMGTTDGTTLDPNGIRVFFQSGPTVTSGSGTISVIPDGTATFTGPGQAYYQYNQVLAQNATSAARTWTFVMPATVTGFSFVVLVSAPVQYPNGYITLDGNLPGAGGGDLQPGATHQLAAVVKTALGDSVPGAVTAFASGNPNRCTVSGTGLVTGVRAGSCTVNATSGARSGSIVFSVTGTTRTWTGATSTDWSVGSNWSGGVVPAGPDSVVVPAGVPNFPVLTANVNIGGVTVADLATLDVASFDLTVKRNVATGATAGSGILASGTGTVFLVGGGTVHGRLPRATVTGNYSLDGPYWGAAPETVQGGRITVTGFELTIN